MQVRVSRFLLLAGVQCLHDDCVIVIVNQGDTGSILAPWHWRDCNSKRCSGGAVDRKLSNKLAVLRELYDFAGQLVRRERRGRDIYRVPIAGEQGPVRRQRQG